MGQEQCLPDVDKFTYWIERLYESKSLRDKYAQAAVAQAQRFSWDTAASKFDSLLTVAIDTARAAGEIPPEAIAGT